MVEFLLLIIGLVIVLLVLGFLVIHSRICRLEQRPPIATVFIPVSKSRRSDFEPSMN